MTPELQYNHEGAEQIFTQAQHVATDMNDTLLATRPEFLRAQVAAAVIYAKDTSIAPPELFAQVMSSGNQPEQDDFVRNMIARGAPAVGFSSGELMYAVDDFVVGALPKDGRHDLMTRRFGFEEIPQFWAAYNGFSEAHKINPVHYIDFIPGAKEWLELMYELRDAGKLKSVSLITNADARKFALHFPVLEHHGVARFDHVLRTKDNPEVPAPKPDPACFEVLQRYAGIQAGERAIYFGNYDEDAEAVQAANEAYPGVHWDAMLVNPRDLPISVHFPHLMFRNFHDVNSIWKQVAK